MNKEFFVGKPSSLCGSVVGCEGDCVHIRSLKHQFEVSSKLTTSEIKWTEKTYEAVFSNYKSGTEGCSQRQKVLEKMTRIYEDRKRN